MRQVESNYLIRDIVDYLGWPSTFLEQEEIMFLYWKALYKLYNITAKEWVLAQKTYKTQLRTFYIKNNKR